VAVVVEDRFRAIFEDNTAIEQILPPKLAALRTWRPALCLNLHGGNRSAWLTAGSSAHYRAGFAHYRHQFVYNVRIPRAQQILGVERAVHTAEHLASAMFYLGAPLEEVEWGRPPGLPNTKTAVLHPVAATPNKTWSLEGFLAVADHLKCSGLDPVFIGAASDDLSPFREYPPLSGAPLAEIQRLIRSACLFVGNDSGPAHMAAAAGLPVVVIFGASDPAIWGPWRTQSEVVAAPGGITQVTTAQVLAAVERLGVHA